MFLWVAFVNPWWYRACYTAMSMRHAAWGMSWEQHRQATMMWYGIDPAWFGGPR